MCRSLYLAYRVFTDRVLTLVNSPVEALMPSGQRSTVPLMQRRLLEKQKKRELHMIAISILIPNGNIWDCVKCVQNVLSCYYLGW